MSAQGRRRVAKGAGSEPTTTAASWERPVGPGDWDQLRGHAPRSVQVDGARVGRGSRVVLRPRPGGDVFDAALAGRVAQVERIEQEVDGTVKLAVVVEDDPGRDLGERRQPGHSFFFLPEELEPLAEQPLGAAAQTRVLVAGIGNVFLGDDGFGVELAHRLAASELPAGVEVIDYGIRGMDLAYAMLEDYDAVLLLDATPRGQAPGTLYVLEPELDEAEVSLDAHGMDPVKVLGFARALGAPARRVLVLGCEPLETMHRDGSELRGELSPPVLGALDAALPLAAAVLENLVKETERSTS